MTNVEEDLEEREPLYTVGGNINWQSHYRKQYGRSSKRWTSLDFPDQWLKLHASTVGAKDLIPGWGPKIQHAHHMYGQKIKKKKLKTELPNNPAISL